MSAADIAAARQELRTLREQQEARAAELRDLNSTMRWKDEPARTRRLISEAVATSNQIDKLLRRRR